MRKMEIENWVTTNAFRNSGPLPDGPLLFFRLFDGLKPDNDKAGYTPDSSPTITANPNSKTTFDGCSKIPLLTTVPVNRLKKGKQSAVISSAATNAIRQSDVESVKN